MRSAAVALALLAALPRVAGAQETKGAGALPALDALAGRWTVAADGNCGRATYRWTIEGEVLRFVGPAGAADVERVVARRGDGFTAVTLSSPTSPPGTRWDFAILGPDQLRVVNLSTGRGFPLRRCPPTVEAAVGAWSYVAPSASEGAKIFWSVPGDNHGDVFFLCAPDGRTFYVSFAGRDLPARGARVTVSAGGTTTTFDARTTDGPVGGGEATLPAGHPILAMLRGAGSLRVRSSGGELTLDLALSGAAEPARRFEAACRPR